MTHACACLASPRSRPNTRLSVSVSPRRALLPTALVPSGEAGLPSPPPARPRSGAQRNGGRRRCAREGRTAEAQPLSSCQRPPLRADAPCRREKGGWRAAETLQGGGGSRDGNREGHHYMPCPLSPLQPTGPPTRRGLRRRVTAALLRRGGVGGSRGEETASPPHPPFASAQPSEPRSLRAAGSYLHFVTRLACLSINMEPRRRRGGVTWWEGGLQAPRGRGRGGLAAPHARARGGRYRFLLSAPPPLPHPPPAYPPRREPGDALGGAGPASPPRRVEKAGSEGQAGRERWGIG